MSGCVHCDDGFIVTCIDDMCRGAGECIHGDGMSLCPYCEGDLADADGDPFDDQIGPPEPLDGVREFPA